MRHLVNTLPCVTCLVSRDRSHVTKSHGSRARRLDAESRERGVRCSARPLLLSPLLPHLSLSLSCRVQEPSSRDLGSRDSLSREATEASPPLAPPAPWGKPSSAMVDALAAMPRKPLSAVPGRSGLRFPPPSPDTLLLWSLWARMGGGMGSSGSNPGTSVLLA
jgi:hypothetical protein